MSEHDPYKVEKEESNKLAEHLRQQHIGHAIDKIEKAVAGLDDDARKELLELALARVGSRLLIRRP